MAAAFDTDNLLDSLQVPFPAGTKQVAGLVNGIQTDVMTMNFSDKIMVTISQAGRLAHWVGANGSTEWTLLTGYSCTYQWRT
jgi:proteasome assembly chaperone 3